MVPNMQNQGSNFGTGSKFRTSEPVPGTGSAISGWNASIQFIPTQVREQMVHPVDDNDFSHSQLSQRFTTFLSVTLSLGVGTTILSE